MFARIVLIAVTTVANTAPVQTQERSPEVIAQLEARWTTSCDYTRAIAEQMPPDKYSFRPTPEQMTFGEQLLHIAEQNHLILSELRGKELSPGPSGVGSKAAVLKRLADCQALGLSVLREKGAIALSDTLNGFMLALDHSTHHRGQLAVYLRAVSTRLRQPDSVFTVATPAS